MAKYGKKKNKQKTRKKQMNPKKSSTGRIILLILLTVLLGALIWLASILSQREIPTLEHSGMAGQDSQSAQSGESGQQELPDIQTEQEVTEPQPIELEDGLQILHIAGYAGMYMEDGSNEVVSNVMMLILENTGSEDLQLARISIAYSDFTAEFEVTNLPAGEMAVLLEKNRHAATGEDYRSIQVKNVVFFPEAMSLREDRLKITGSNGTLKVENISGEDIAGDIYIYYKHSASDLLYGGITYRVAVRGGLKAGESTTVIAGHYTPDSCRLLMADCGD
jgi:cytoskeletal protein RodZ